MYRSPRIALVAIWHAVLEIQGLFEPHKIQVVDLLGERRRPQRTLPSADLAEVGDCHSAFINLAWDLEDISILHRSWLS